MVLVIGVASHRSSSRVLRAVSGLTAKIAQVASTSLQETVASGVVPYGGWREKTSKKLGSRRCRRKQTGGI
jgi:hypothetical protein